MQIGIRGVFGFSEIFGGKLDFTTRCLLEVSGKYSLIHAEVDNLDILQALNQAFDLGLGDCSLHVASAGFFTFSAHSGAPAVTLNKVFPDSPVPATIAKDFLPVVDTTSFWLTVDLSGNHADRGLFGSIVEIGVAPDTQLSLSATFAKGARAASAIRTANYTLSLDGGINLFTLFEFRRLRLVYSIGAATRILIQGDIGVDLFGTRFDFSGTVVSDSVAKVVTADIRAQGSTELASMFGTLFPRIAFKGLSFKLHYPYGKGAQAARFMVRGSCSFGGHAFTGLLYMEGKTPVLASVVFTQSASISTLFSQCLQPASWPADLIDLTLKAGSQVYYNSNAQPLALTLSSDASGPTLLPVPGGPPGQGEAAPPISGRPVVYQHGFNMSASFTLSLLDSINVSGDVVVTPQGVTASIEIATPIDLYLVRITRHGHPSLGPVCSIGTQGNRGSMRLDADLLFFGEDFGANATVELAKSDDGSLLASTTLSPTRDYPPLLTTASRLGFSYSDKKGFQLTDWPEIREVLDLVDFFGELKKMANGGPGTCGQIADFVCQKLLKQTYSVQPNFSSDSHGLSLSLSVVCKLSFCGNVLQDEEFARITLPRLVIAIPPGINLDPDSPHYLWKVIAQAIAGAAAQFIEALLSDGEAIASFLVLFAGKQAVNYAATLICQGATSGAVAGAVAAGVVAAGLTLGTEAVAVGLVLAATVAAIGSLGGGSGQGAGRAAPPHAPAHVAARVRGSSITGHWSPSSGAQHYMATLIGPHGPLAGSGALDYDKTSHDFGNIDRLSTLSAGLALEVIASNPAGPSPPTTATIRFLAAPTGLAMQATAVSIDASWNAVPDAAAYVLGWDSPGGATGELSVSGGGAPTVDARIALPMPVVDGVWSITVQAIPADDPGPFVASPRTAPRHVAVTGPRSPEEMAASYFSVGEDGARCGQALAGAFPALTGETLASAMAQGGYAASATADGLHAAFPSMTPAHMALALAHAYQAPARTPGQLCQRCCRRAIGGADCGKAAIRAFATLSPDMLARAMAEGGYAARAAAEGLAAAFPGISPQQMARSLATAYA